MALSIARRICSLTAVLSIAITAIVAQQGPAVPDAPLKYGAFTMRLAAGGVFTLNGQGWPPFTGTWKTDGRELTVTTTGGPPACSAPGRYGFKVDGSQVSLAVIADDCVPRRMILHASTWRPESEAGPRVERHVTWTGPGRAPSLPAPAAEKGSWPSFRGPYASGIADGAGLPEHWDPKTKQNILWRTPIPGSGMSRCS